jgi:hypothetical protein
MRSIDLINTHHILLVVVVVVVVVVAVTYRYIYRQSRWYNRHYGGTINNTDGLNRLEKLLQSTFIIK